MGFEFILRTTDLNSKTTACHQQQARLLYFSLKWQAETSKREHKLQTSEPQTISMRETRATNEIRQATVLGEGLRQCC